MKHMSFETLMDVLDWFDDSLYDYVHHICCPSSTARNASGGRCRSCRNTLRS